MSYNYGNYQQPKPRRGCALGCGFWVGLLFIVLIGVAAYGYYSYTAFQRAYPHIQAGYNLSITEVNTIEGKLNDPTTLQTSDFDTASKSFDQANVEFEAAKSDLQYVTPVLPYVGWVPTYGPDLAAIPHMLNMSTSITSAASSISAASKKMAQEATNGSPLKIIIVAGAVDLQNASNQLNSAKAERDQIDITKIHTPELQAALKQYDDSIKPFSDQVQKLLQEGK
jgi:hypothetical protein